MSFSWIVVVVFDVVCWLLLELGVVDNVLVVVDDVVCWLLLELGVDLVVVDDALVVEVSIILVLLVRKN